MKYSSETNDLLTKWKKHGNIIVFINEFQQEDQLKFVKNDNRNKEEQKVKRFECKRFLSLLLALFMIPLLLPKSKTALPMRSSVPEAAVTLMVAAMATTS